MNFAPVGSNRRLHRRTFVVAICSLKSFGGSEGRGDNICLNRRNFQRRLHRDTLVPFIWALKRLGAGEEKKSRSHEPCRLEFQKGLRATHETEEC
jgi:hypothetical protein